ncbi:unnamed protein product [Protopolystoma xenopodis]|uniref:CRIM domain-containing protein n=1 Tax=Protopolystoma xenopodis TaxID=117903 RepID=A0A448WBX4_9PLAT|nr:unnamed protein product [Protopolystoma xenopodis]
MSCVAINFRGVDPMVIFYENIKEHERSVQKKAEIKGADEQMHISPKLHETTRLCLPDRSKKSALTVAIKARALQASLQGTELCGMGGAIPFADYAIFDSRPLSTADESAFTGRTYVVWLWEVPGIASSTYFVKICPSPKATVRNAIGLCLWQFCTQALGGQNEGQSSSSLADATRLAKQASTPAITELFLSGLALHFLDSPEEGVDTDFPPLHPEDLITKYEFEQLALIARPTPRSQVRLLQMQQHTQKWPPLQPTTISTTLTGNAASLDDEDRGDVYEGAASGSISSSELASAVPTLDRPLLVHVHLAQGISTLQFSPDTPLSRVLSETVRRRRLRQHAGVYTYRLEALKPVSGLDLCLEVDRKEEDKFEARSNDVLSELQSTVNGAGSGQQREELDLKTTLRELVMQKRPLKFALVRENSKWMKV